ncbi:unnamed protein product, partial [Adineta steineri]
MQNTVRDYQADKNKIKDFLNEFEVDTEDGYKASKYVKQLRNLANREQTTLVIDLDDIATVDPELADAISENCRRYTQLFAQVVQELLPELKDKEVQNKDVLDVYIEHRTLMEQRMHHNTDETRDPMNRYPEEL